MVDGRFPLMARAVYRGYWQGGKRSAKVTRLHVIRETPVRRSTYRPSCDEPRLETWCGQGAGQHTNSEPVIFDPMPATPPEGLAWCPKCIGHLAEVFGLLGTVAEELAAYDPDLWVDTVGMRWAARREQVAAKAAATREAR